MVTVPGSQTVTSTETQLSNSSTPGALAVHEARPSLLPETDELFRGIYTRAGITLGSEVLAVCSALAGEGKTTVALGLAITVAQDFPERRVLLVETDTERPTLARDFDVDNSPGLLEHLVEGLPLEDACRPTYLENLDLLTVGAPAHVSGRPLRSSRMASAVDAMHQNYDLIILDVPAVLVNSDALLLCELADAAVLVVRAGVTPSALVGKALEHLDSGKLRGVVLNESRTSSPGWLRRLCGF
jgi:capsular exopolysaccharide synthesis family protein